MHSISKNDQSHDSDASLEVFIHPENGTPYPLRVSENQTIGDILKAADIDLDDDIQVCLGDAEDLPQLDDSDEDELEPIDLGLKPGEVGLQKHGHLTCHRCRAIKVEVSYNCEDVTRRFRPSATIERVTRWAVRRLGLDAAAAQDLELQFCDSETRPRPEERLGELVSGRSCKLCFSLVAPVLVNG